MARIAETAVGDERLQVFVTVPDFETAEQIGRRVLEVGLAACVQVLGPIVSTYRWQGRVEQSREWLCLLKTNRTRYAELEQAIITMHPYEVPEVICVPITAGYQGYLNWFDAALAGTDTDKC